MMDTWILPVIGLALAFGGFALRLKSRGGKPLLALLALPLCVAAGILGAKMLYMLAMMTHYAWEELTALNPERMSVFGGAVGVCLGVALAAWWMRSKPLDALDAFAPCGALLLGFVRAAEYGMGYLGAGTYLEDGHLFARFPLGIQDEWGIVWFLSVCTLEALAALGVAVVFFLRNKPAFFRPPV